MLKAKSYWLWILALLFSVSILLSGCGSTQSAPASTSNSNSISNANTNASAAKVVNLGWSGPISGGAALYGKDVLDGINMALDEINGQGGITIGNQKYTFKLISLDDQYSPNMTATNARRLRTEHKTPVIFCPHSGGIFAMQQFNQDEKFLIAGYSSEPKIVQQGNKLTFRPNFPYDAYNEPWSKAVMEKYGKKVAIIAGTHQYAKDWVTTFIPAWEKLGGTVTGNFSFDYNKETDFYTYVSKAIATNPDVMFIGGASQPTAMVIKQARELGFKGGFFVMEQAKFEDMEKIIPLSQMTGAVCLLPISRYSNPEAQKFTEKFQAKFSKVPNHEHVLNYTLTKIVVKGMEKAGSVDDAAKIFEGMKQSFPMSDIAYDIKAINDDGSVDGTGQGVMIIDGKYGPPIPVAPLKK